MPARSAHAATFMAISCTALLLPACDKGPHEAKPVASLSRALPAPAAPSRALPPGSAAPVIDPMTMLDTDMKAVIDQLVALGGKPIETLSADEARRQPTPADAVQALLKTQGKSTAPEAVGKVLDRTIPGPGGALPVRVYTPAIGKAPYPVIVYYHGGGFVIASNDTYDASARGLANGAGALVLAVEYRKAPEHKFPAAHEDALAGYEWALNNAASIGGDPKRIALVGESAGGNLAANVSIAARDKKERLPLYQVLVYPIAGSDMNTASYREDENAKPLSKAMMAWFSQNYFRTPADGQDTRIDLVHANLAGLPPTTIINAQVDPLRTDGDRLGAQLQAANVTVVRKTYSGVTHEFFGMSAAVGAAKDAMSLATSALKTAFE